MASLYNIQEDLLRIFNEVESNDGEITDDQYNLLCIKQEELKTKLDCYVKAIKEWEKDADFCKKEKQSINNRQNVYKNRVERLKRAMLDAVHNFGEQGKSNMFIELPTYRIFTKAVKSVKVNDERINIFIKEFNRYIHELTAQGILYTGKDVDLKGILDCINANCKAEHGDDFECFTLNDLITLKVNISTTATIHDLFMEHPYILQQLGTDIHHTDITDVTDKNEWKSMIQVAETAKTSNITMAEIVSEDSLQIK